MKILTNDQVGAEVDKFYEFPRVEKYQKAKAIINFFDRHPTSSSLDLTQERDFLRNPSNAKTEIEKTIIAYWGCNKNGRPKSPGQHWTGKNARQRAESLGPKYEQFYVKTYSWLSLYVHPGRTGYEGFGESTLKAVFGRAHDLAQELFREATVICADEFKLSQLDNLKAPIPAILEQLRMKPGEILLQKDIERLKESSQQSENGN